MRKDLLIICVCMTAAALYVRGADEAERMKFADGLYARGMYDLAIKEYEGILSEYPKSSSTDVVRFRLGESYRHKGDQTNSEKYFRDLYIKNQKSKYRFKAGFRRAELHRLAGRNENALTLYQLLIDDKAPKEIAAAAHFYKGELLLKAGKGKEALNSFETVSAHYRDTDFYPYALIQIGSLHSKSPEGKKEALKAYSAVVKSSAGPRLVAEALFQSAEIHLREKSFSESAKLYSKLLKDYPDDQRSADAILQAAWAQYNSGRYADALKLSSKTLKGLKPDAPSHPEWLYLKANCERQLSRNSSAVSTYAELIKKHPSSQFAGSARYEKALASYRSGDYAAAVKEAGKIELDTGDIKLPEKLRKDVYWLLAESHSALKQDDDAIQYYRIITKDFPKSDVAGDAAYRLAFNLHQRKLYKEASDYYQVVARKYKKKELAPRALLASGVCLAKLDQHKQAVRDLDELVRTYVSDPLREDALYQKAVSEIKLGRSEAALSSLSQLLKDYPKSKLRGLSSYWRGVLMKKAGRIDDAVSDFRSVAGGAVDAETARDAEFQLAVLLHKKGKHEESAKLFQKLLETPVSSRFSPSLLEWLAGHKARKGKHDEGIAAAGYLVKHHKQDEWQQAGLALLGRCYRAKGKIADAEKHYERALKVKVKTAYTAETALRLAEIKKDAGDHKKASKLFARAAAEASWDDMLSIRAMAYKGLAETAKARKDYESAARYFMSVSILFDDEKIVAECMYGAYQAFSELGRKDDADKVGAELKERYPKSSYAERIKSGS